MGGWRLGLKCRSICFLIRDIEFEDCLKLKWESHAYDIPLHFELAAISLEVLPCVHRLNASTFLNGTVDDPIDLGHDTVKVIGLLRYNP